MSKIDKARRVLAAIKAEGCVPELKGNWVGFKPPPSLDLLMEAGELADEIAQLVKADE